MTISLLNGPESSLKQDLNVLWELYNFYEQCESQQWASYSPQGIIPYCLWKDQTNAKIPFISGMIDAAYQDMHGLSQIPLLIKRIRESTIELAYAYTVGAFKCTPEKIEAGKEEYREVVTRLALKEPSTGVWSWLEELLTTTGRGRLDELDEYFDDCGEVLSYQEGVAELIEMATDFKEMLALYFRVESKITTYFATLGEGNDVSWYERGFLTCQVGLTFIPVGGATKAKKAKNVLEALADDANWSKFTDEIASFASFTSKQIDHYVLLATKQGDKSRVMLGKFDNAGPSGYISRAGTDHVYFDMGPSKWAEAEALVKGNVDEMWKINKQFIDQQKALGKEFYLSHDPDFATGFYLREVNYLTDDLHGTIVQINNSTWKVVW